MASFDLSDEEWALIQPLLPKPGRGAKRCDDRKVLNGIFYILRTGAPWQDLPERYGPRTTVYNRYVRWGRKGVWKSVFDALAKEVKDSLIFIDGSIVKAHRAAAGSKKGNFSSVLAASRRRFACLSADGSRGGRASKVHAAVDEYGRPLRLVISGGNVHDSQMFDAFTDWKAEPLAIVADKAYSSAKIRRQIADEGALAVIPSKSNARNPIPHDKNLYAMRNIVERFFCKMKDMRRLATRFEKTAINFQNMIYMFAIR